MESWRLSGAVSSVIAGLAIHRAALAFRTGLYGIVPVYLRGALIDNWFAANLTGDKASGLGRWSEPEIAAFLKTGHSGKVAAFGR